MGRTGHFGCYVQQTATDRPRAWPRVRAAGPGLALITFIGVVGWYGHTHRHLGMPWAPFFFYPKPRVTWWAVPALVAVAGCVVSARRLFSARSDRWFMIGAYTVALVARLAVNMIRRGPAEWSWPFTRYEGGQEYIATARRVTQNPIDFLERFAALVPTLPTHSAGHPPGPTLVAISLNDLGLGGAWPLAVLVILVGTLVAPLTFMLARSLGHDRSTARLAALLAAFAPAAVIESVTSMDAVFAALAVATLVVIARGRYWLGGGLVWLCSFMSYALVAVPVWGAVVLWRRRSAATAVRALVCAAVVTFTIYLVLRIGLGYDLIGAFQATNQRYLHGPGSEAMNRPIRFWLFGDVAAFLLGLGVPIVLGLGIALRRRSAESLALALVVTLATIGGYTKGEVERIWLFMIPLAALAAAAYLPRRGSAVTVMLALLAVQAAAVEMFVWTTW